MRKTKRSHWRVGKKKKLHALIKNIRKDDNVFYAYNRDVEQKTVI